MKKMRILLMMGGIVNDNFNAYDFPIPREGEFVRCEGIDHKVTRVMYSFDEDTPYAKVYLEASKLEAPT